MQQVLAFETDLLEYDDIFNGSHVIEARTAELVEAATTELDEILALGGAFEAIEEMKARLVRSQAARARRIEVGEQKVIGVNTFTETAESPLEGEGAILRVDPAVEVAAKEELKAWKAQRDSAAVEAALAELKRVAATSENILPATIALAHAGGTTGEWGAALREVFGEYRAPTGVSGAVGGRGEEMAPTVAKVKALVGGPPRFLVAKPGLDGHSNGAEQVAVAARDAGFEVVYQGIRLTPQQIADAARDEDVDVIGLSILSGGHLELVPEVLRLLRAEGVDAPVIVGGIIPDEDAAKLLEHGVAAVYTPKDYALSEMMGEVVDLVAAHRAS
jgi:(2R)-ethylmalonyl-CoA mutase